jgi:hypothetical protein
MREWRFERLIQHLLLCQSEATRSTYSGNSANRPKCLQSVAILVHQLVLDATVPNCRSSLQNCNSMPCLAEAQLPLKDLSRNLAVFTFTYKNRSRGFHAQRLMAEAQQDWSITHSLFFCQPVPPITNN